MLWKQFTVPTDAACVTSEADALLRPGCGGGRIRASGLSTRGRGAPLPLRVLRHPEADSLAVVQFRALQGVGTKGN